MRNGQQSKFYFKQREKFSFGRIGWSVLACILIIKKYQFVEKPDGYTDLHSGDSLMINKIIFIPAGNISRFKCFPMENLHFIVRGSCNGN